MKVSFMAGALAGAVIVTAGSAVAGYHMYSTAHSAKVLSAKALTRTIKIPRQECHDESVTRTKPIKDQDRLLGTGIGAVVGGLLGHEVGGGNGKTLATIAGAAGGGYAGNKIQEKTQQGDTYTATEQRCNTVYDMKEEPAGFEVVYDYQGHEHRVRMDHDPGGSLPVKDGQVVVASSKNASSSTAER
ncbi:MAG: glycine zipper 2TM domain-containing protein [Steroidobacteraceae bacterium]